MKPLVTAPETRSQYIVHCLNSPNYLKIVDKLSTGSTKTSRKRFKEDRFQSMKVERPQDDDDVETMVRMLNRADVLRVRQQQLLDRKKELHEGMA